MQQVNDFEVSLSRLFQREFRCTAEAKTRVFM